MINEIEFPWQCRVEMEIAQAKFRQRQRIDAMFAPPPRNVVLGHTAKASGKFSTGISEYTAAVGLHSTRVGS